MDAKSRELMDSALEAAKQVHKENRLLSWWITWRAKRICARINRKLEKQRERCRKGKHDFSGYKLVKEIAVYMNPTVREGELPRQVLGIYKATCLHCNYPDIIQKTHAGL